VQALQVNRTFSKEFLNFASDTGEGSVAQKIDRKKEKESKKEEKPREDKTQL
jgi:hypothetical protein